MSNNEVQITEYRGFPRSDADGGVRRKNLSGLADLTGLRPCPLYPLIRKKTLRLDQFIKPSLF